MIYPFDVDDHDDDDDDDADDDGGDDDDDADDDDDDSLFDKEQLIYAKGFSFGIDIGFEGLCEGFEGSTIGRGLPYRLETMHISI